MNTKMKIITLLLLLCYVTEEASLFSGYFTHCPESCKCNSTTLKVDCSGLGLKQLPDLRGIPIKELDISKNLLKKFPGVVSMFKSLEYLNLRGNEICKLTAETLSGLFNLKVLILDQNCIKNWHDITPNKFLLPAESLQILSLADNPLQVNIDNEKNYLRSRSLTHLDLTNTQLTTESVKYFGNFLPNLTNLILRNTPMSEFPNIQHFEKLEFLDISSTRVTRIDWGTINLSSNLKKINLSSNPGLQFSYHNEKIYPQIQELNVSNCGMATIDTSNFPNLESLLMKGNVIQNISRSSFNISQSMKNIDLSDNAIQQLYSHSFGALRELQNLDLSNNKIQNVNLNVFKENTALTSLDLSGNPIMGVNGTTPVSLKKLNMSRCRLHHIEKQIFNNMTELESLDLSQNFLADFPVSIYLPSLKYLDLSFNKLSTIRWSTFRQCVNLETLKLNGNRFTTPFHRKDFENNKKLTKIYLADNPFKCDCDDPYFKDFYDFVTEHPRKIQDNLRCDKPTGLTWETVCPNFFDKILKHDNFKIILFVVAFLIVALLLLSYLIVSCLKKSGVKRSYSSVSLATESRNNIYN